MRATLVRTGGFAGIRLTTKVDTDSLKEDERKQLQQLIESADFFNLPASLLSASPQPDRFQYTLTIEDANRTHTVTMAETSLPATVRPLTDWLSRMGRRG
jgi:hypothetical protein